MRAAASIPCLSLRQSLRVLAHCCFGFFLKNILFWLFFPKGEDLSSLLSMQSPLLPFISVFRCFILPCFLHYFPLLEKSFSSFTPFFSQSTFTVFQTKCCHGFKLKLYYCSCQGNFFIYLFLSIHLPEVVKKQNG